MSFYFGRGSCDSLLLRSLATFPFVSCAPCALALLPWSAVAHGVRKHSISRSKITRARTELFVRPYPALQARAACNPRDAQFMPVSRKAYTTLATPAMLWRKYCYVQASSTMNSIACGKHRTRTRRAAPFSAIRGRERAVRNRLQNYCRRPINHCGTRAGPIMN